MDNIIVHTGFTQTYTHVGAPLSPTVYVRHPQMLRIMLDMYKADEDKFDRLYYALKEECLHTRPAFGFERKVHDVAVIDDADKKDFKAANINNIKISSETEEGKASVWPCDFVYLSMYAAVTVSQKRTRAFTYVHCSNAGTHKHRCYGATNSVQALAVGTSPRGHIHKYAASFR